MPLQFANGQSSTSFAIEAITRAIRETEAAGGTQSEQLRALAATLGEPVDWRKNYQRVFAELSAFEFTSAEAALQRALLAATGDLIQDSTGRSLTALVSADSIAAAREAVVTVEIRGAGQASALATVGAPTAEAMIEHQLAEPGVRTSLATYDDWISKHADAPTQGEVLVAIGANAELSIAPDWLAIGGKVIAVARRNRAKWANLIAEARASSGTLIVPVLASRAVGVDLESLDDEQLAELAGLDLQDDATAISAWVSGLAVENKTDRFVLLGSVYAPGKNQILASAAQDAVMTALSRDLPRERLVLGWLATPLDSVVRSKSRLYELEANYKKLSVRGRIRAGFWHLFGGLKAPNTAQLEHAKLADELAVFDYSAQRQGSSYLFAKRIERWRANVAEADGIKTWFQVAPPAQTHSTLDYKIVRAAYRGLTRLGFTAFEAWMLRDLLCSMLIGSLKGQMQRDELSETAIHGGIWRLPYDPQTVWLPAAGIGWVELLRNR